jgi:hypothetical protein
MTTPFSPQLIGETEKTLNALLVRYLDGSELTEPHWVTLRVASMLDGQVDGDGLVDAVTDRAHFGNAAALVGELVRNFLNQEAIPGIEYEYPLAQRLVPGIKLEEVNRLAGDWLGQKNRVIAVNAPEKAGVTVPSASQLLAVFDTHADLLGAVTHSDQLASPVE